MRRRSPIEKIEENIMKPQKDREGRVEKEEQGADSTVRCWDCFIIVVKSTRRGKHADLEDKIAAHINLGFCLQLVNHITISKSINNFFIYLVIELDILNKRSSREHSFHFSRINSTIQHENTHSVFQE